MAQVIRLPLQHTAAAARSTASGTVTAASTLSQLGAWDIDDWGRDDTLTAVAARVARLRWRVTVGGLEHLPTARPSARSATQVPGALLVTNTRRFALTPWLVALSLGHELDRPVRFVGRPDSAPFGALARRLGGLLARPDEVAGALRDGQLLVVGADGVFNPRSVGAIDHRIVGAAVAAGCPVIPVAVSVSQSSRSARIELSAAIRPPRRRRGPLAELELTDQVAKRIGVMLEEFGGARTGTPLDWLSLSGMGGN